MLDKKRIGIGILIMLVIYMMLMPHGSRFIIYIAIYLVIKFIKYVKVPKVNERNEIDIEMSVSEEFDFLDDANDLDFDIPIRDIEDFYTEEDDDTLIEETLSDENEIDTIPIQDLSDFVRMSIEDVEIDEIDELVVLDQTTDLREKEQTESLNDISFESDHPVEEDHDRIKIAEINKVGAINTIGEINDI
jgi:hypothetical protein